MAATSPENPSHLRVAPASPVTRSNERTNERTHVTPNNDCAIPEVSDVRARVQAEDVDIPRLTDVLEAGVFPTGERFPVIRSGEREPIPYFVRAAIWLRDKGICQKCGKRNPRPWELDHIVPWSAGGSDVSTNLRVLCEPCNQQRSNYDDRTTFARRPVTWWCHRCYSDATAWNYDDGASCPRHRSIYDYANRCAVERTAHYMQDGTWHQSTPVEIGSKVAFCAHCGSPGMTDVTL